MFPILYPPPSSLLPPHTIPLGRPSALFFNFKKVPFLNTITLGIRGLGFPCMNSGNSTHPLWMWLCRSCERRQRLLPFSWAWLAWGFASVNRMWRKWHTSQGSEPGTLLRVSLDSCHGNTHVATMRTDPTFTGWKVREFVEREGLS